MMSAEDVVAVMLALSQSRAMAWLDGGWGVDALIERQTRPHDDLDLVVPFDDLRACTDALSTLGYSLHIDELPTRIVFRAERDRQVDIHPVTWDADGGGLQTQPDGSTFRYPPGSFWYGLINHYVLPCLSPQVQALCHSGYTLDDNDIHDMRLLCAAFDLPLPAGCEAS